LFIPDPDAVFFPSRILDPGVKKAPNPGSRIQIRNTARRPALSFKTHQTPCLFSLFLPGLLWPLLLSLLFMFLTFCLEKPTNNVRYSVHSLCVNPYLHRSWWSHDDASTYVPYRPLLFSGTVPYVSCVKRTSPWTMCLWIMCPDPPVCTPLLVAALLWCTFWNVYT